MVQHNYDMLITTYLASSHLKSINHHFIVNVKIAILDHSRGNTILTLGSGSQTNTIQNSTAFILQNKRFRLHLMAQAALFVSKPAQGNHKKSVLRERLCATT